MSIETLNNVSLTGLSLTDLYIVNGIDACECCRSVSSFVHCNLFAGICWLNVQIHQRII